MTDRIFDEASTNAQLEKLQQLPAAEQGGVGVVVENGDVGVTGAVSKQLGTRGWFVQGEGSWMRRSGYRVAGWFGWKKPNS
ncbi:MAG TPA: hypothetical protein VN803_06795 [Gemmatimonadales bacterium]|nr:hypothetical protein [Gemmatimonadales bacterium]